MGKNFIRICSYLFLAILVLAGSYRTLGYFAIKKYSTCENQVLNEVSEVNSRINSDEGFEGKQVTELKRDISDRNEDLEVLRTCPGIFANLFKQLNRGYLALLGSSFEYLENVETIAERMERDEDTWGDIDSVEKQFNEIEMKKKELESNLSDLEGRFLIEF